VNFISVKSRVTLELAPPEELLLLVVLLLLLLPQAARTPTIHRLATRKTAKRLSILPPTDLPRSMAGRTVPTDRVYKIPVQGRTCRNLTIPHTPPSISHNRITDE
jgi:hypothetical protein